MLIRASVGNRKRGSLPIALAFFLSIFFHGALLFVWSIPIPSPVSQVTSVLTVVFVEGSKHNSLVAKHRENPSQKKTVTVSNTPAQGTSGVSGALLNLDKPDREGINDAQMSSGVSVRLTIDSAGKVSNIHWTKLPALTNQQFVRLEKSIRERIYPLGLAGNRINETVDALRVLKEIEEAEAK